MRERPYPLAKLPLGPAQAIIRWPEGLSGEPVIFPMGETFEESERIREILEGLLGNRG